jgi:hypothetical protein
MANFENHERQSRAEDPVVIQKIREQFANEWEELVTKPGEFITEEDFTYLDKIRNGEKVPSKHKWLRDKLVRICQDLRLTPEEIDQVQELFLE